MAIFVTNWEGAVGAAAAQTLLSSGGRALDAVVEALATAEERSTSRAVGSHGHPNILGEVELDASLMDGDTLQSGAVGALRGFKHPIRVAAAVLTRLPHVLLVGEGAGRFAKEIEAERAPEPSDAQRKILAEFLAALPDGDGDHWPPERLAPFLFKTGFAAASKDTAVCLAQDRAGTLASGATTSGWPLKYPGRLGDSPCIGAGHYSISGVGAAACTHTGEMTLRALTSHTVVLLMRQGLSVRNACFAALEDLRRLRGGTLSHVVIHAIDAAGQLFVLSTGPKHSVTVWRDGMDAPELHAPEICSL